ncbi:unnamed protein product [Musa acuminata subsp. malaccensis]|uniref:(wild Malaysian banana) hypothetical protein n=1 Tax=Musa acuminata subsp. malaccensis TaxID=214687 RepID=A0A804HN85_MUSAM|nr:unnamed protein product [Musa acuminata subsp. malaccensis]
MSLFTLFFLLYIIGYHHHICHLLLTMRLKVIFPSMQKQSSAFRLQRRSKCYQCEV